MNRDDLYTALYIRNIEKDILKLFSDGSLSGTAHTCIGQEIVPVSLRHFITDSDQVISNHRGHGHIIAFTGEAEAFLSELLGREGAACRGFGGSQHISIRNVMTTGVQGEGAAIGLGFAWSRKRRGDGSAAFVFTGDGTFGRGSIYESLNMAALMSLPYVLVVENNHIAMTTSESDHMAGSIEDRAGAFGIDYLKVTSQDPDEIMALTGPVISKVRREPAPLVIEFDTVRLAAHSKGDDSRSADEIAEARQRDWHEIYAAKIKEDEHLKSELQEIEVKAAEDAKAIIEIVKRKNRIINE